MSVNQACEAEPIAEAAYGRYLLNLLEQVDIEARPE